jgi:transcriptional regulator with XRE-family HTH domain
MSDTRDILAHNIRRLRKVRGMQVNQLAEAAEISRTFMGMVEHAKVNISIDKVEAIAKVLGVEVYVLFVP